MKPNFMDQPHSHTRAPRISQFAQGWREANEPEHQQAFTGFLVGALAGAIVWLMLMVCLWGVML
jgi:hypothetical protein